MGVWRAPDGWPHRTFAWQGAGRARGAILFQGGRGDLIEKYLESFAHWHEAGFDVTAFDWRGQGGSGRLARDPRVGHVADFGLWVDDLAAYVAEWTAAQPGPHIVIGHSMGGHLVLRALVERRIAPDAAVLVAPMLGFETGPLPKSWAVGLAETLARRFGAERPAWGRNEKPAPPWRTRQHYLTRDDARYSDGEYWRAERPDLVLGPPSWPWMAAAYRSCALLDAPGALEGVTTPIAILCTEGDKLVSPRAIRTAAARLPDANLTMFGKEVAHEILRERDAPRNQALAAIDALLDAVAPPQ